MICAKSNTAHSCCTGSKQPDSLMPCSRLPLRTSHLKTKSTLPWLGIVFHHFPILTFFIEKWLLSADLVYYWGLWPDLSSCTQTTLLSSSLGGPSMFPCLLPQTVSHCSLSVGPSPLDKQKGRIPNSAPTSRHATLRDMPLIDIRTLKTASFFCVWLYFWNIMLKNNNKIKTMPLGSDRFVCLFPSNSLFWCWLK